ncbi:MAG: UDP-N-acetylmuramoyl-tripeptide--D-alanyl-D-alanine ligase, partial [Gammaproteobacteria bacterium]
VALRWYDVLPLASGFLLGFQVNALAILSFNLIYWLVFYLTRSKTQEKKPLVFTSRAVRLYLVSAIFLAIIYALFSSAVYLNESFQLASILFALILLNLATPLVLLIANLIILPLELIIQRYYFCDAKKRLSLMPSLKVIGITGSFGKTTTKYVLNEILRQRHQVLIAPGSYNTPMGIAKIVRSDLKPTHEIFVAELSAKKRWDIKELCDMVHPTMGVLTAIGEQHLETFKSLENIKNTKYELIECLPKDSLAFFNMDDPNCRDLAFLSGKDGVFYGLHADNLDYRAIDIEVQPLGSEFTVLKKDGGSIRLQTKLLGEHNIYNILAAVAVASEMGIPLADMVYPIRTLKPVEHRLELKKIGPGATLIDDSFNSNPVGSKTALEVLAAMSGGKKIIITPGMVELGKKEYALNREFGRHIAKVCNYVILVGKKQTIALQDGLTEENFLKNNIYLADSFQEAYKHLQSFLRPEDVVLFENDLPDNYDRKL